MVREGLRLLIERHCPGATVVAETGLAGAALEFARSVKPDVVIMDIHLPDGSGIEASKQILTELPQTRVIVLSAEPDVTFVRAALQAGATGYLLKSCASSELPRAIPAVVAGRMYFCSEVSETALLDYRQSLVPAQPPPHPELSEREREVLRLITEGLRTKEIAERLGVGVKTAETYRKRLIAKVGCNGTAELVRYAIREGIVPL